MKMTHPMMGLAVSVIVSPVLIMSSGLNVNARPSNEVTTLYYSNASKTQIVGGHISLCNGARRSWGQQTQYVLRQSDPCHTTQPSQGSNPPCEFLAKGCSSLPRPRY